MSKNAILYFITYYINWYIHQLQLHPSFLLQRVTDLTAIKPLHSAISMREPYAFTLEKEAQ